MKMLRLLLEVTRTDRIRNEDIKGMVHVRHFGDKVRESRFKSFRHVQKERMNISVGASRQDQEGDVDGR